MISIGECLDNLSHYVPYSLNLHVIEDVSYDAAKRLAETYGVKVLPQDRIWEQLFILHVQIPAGENLDEWIAKLGQEIAFLRITRVSVDIM